MEDKSEKIKLFGSDDEEEDNFDDFKIRPQFQGPHGQQMLELSSQLPKRFKLDERFAEVFEPEYQQDVEDETDKEIIEEREKNIRILESVLGHEVIPKTFDKNKSMKRQVRFDPDNENDSYLVKNQETTSEKPKKSKKKKKVKEEKVEQAIPISKERYIEVCPDLKEILNTASPFTFSQQFSHGVEEILEDSPPTYEKPYEPVEETQVHTFKEKDEPYEPVEETQIHTFKEEDEPYEPVEETQIHTFKEKDENKSQMHFEKFSYKPSIPKPKGNTFFVTEGDPRLKEGIEFFKRPKPLDEIRIEWQRQRENVLKLFRRKKRSGQRSYRTKVQSMQNKFAVRRQNFKR